MRITNDPEEAPGGALAELLRLQTEFQARLTEETISYLRRLQGATAPGAPGTVVLPDPERSIEGAGRAGESAEVVVEVENRQRVHCMITPLVSQLVDAEGVAWSPEVAASPPSVLVAPEETVELRLRVSIPSELPRGTYRGSLILQGFRGDPVLLAVMVDGPLSADAEPPA